MLDTSFGKTPSLTWHIYLLRHLLRQLLFRLRTRSVPIGYNILKTTSGLASVVPLFIRRSTRHCAAHGLHTGRLSLSLSLSSFHYIFIPAPTSGLHATLYFPLFHLLQQHIPSCNIALPAAYFLWQHIVLPTAPIQPSSFHSFGLTAS